MQFIYIIISHVWWVSISPNIWKVLTCSKNWWSFIYCNESHLYLYLQLFEHYIQNFRNFTKKKKLYIILNGININQDEFISTNITLTFGVQKFIMQTKRFLNCWLLLFFNLVTTSYFSFLTFWSNIWRNFKMTLYLHNLSYLLHFSILYNFYCIFVWEMILDKTCIVFWSNPWTNIWFWCCMHS